MRCAWQRHVRQVNVLALVLSVCCLAVPLQNGVDSASFANAPTGSSDKLATTAGSSASSATPYDGLFSTTISYSTLTTSVAWCYDMDALRSLEGDDVQDSYGMYGFDGVLDNYFIYVACSFGLAFVLILVMLVAVCLRDYRAGVRGHERDHSSEDLPLSVITSRASDARYNTSLAGSRPSRPNRLIRTPRRFSRVLRRRHTNRSSSISIPRSNLASSHDIEASAGQPEINQGSVHGDASSSSSSAIPAAAIDTHLAVLAPSIPTEPSHEHRFNGRSVSFSDNALGPRRGEQLPIVSQAAITSTLAGLQQHTNQPTSPLDESDVAAVDALEIGNEVVQPPAYIVSESRAQPSSSRSLPDRGKARAVSPELQVESQRWLAHVATDDKSVLSELRSAASAPVPILHPIASNAPSIPLSSVSEEDRIQSAVRVPDALDSSERNAVDALEPSAPSLTMASELDSAPSLASAPNADSVPPCQHCSFDAEGSQTENLPHLEQSAAMENSRNSNAYTLSLNGSYNVPSAPYESSDDSLQTRDRSASGQDSAQGSVGVDVERQSPPDVSETTASSAVQEKQAEADAEIAHLRALLPSAPTRYVRRNESLPIYDVIPSAPSDIFDAALGLCDSDLVDSHIDNGDANDYAS